MADLDPPFVKELDEKAAKGDAVCQAAATCLQAMRSVLAHNRCVPSPTAYFAATVAALQRQHTNEPATSTALLLVLRKAISAAPPGTVCAKFNDLIIGVANVLRNPDDERVVRQSLGCLMVASDVVFAAGSRPNRKLLKPIFAFLSDERDSVQHQAELTATMVLRRAASLQDEQTLSFAVQQLVQMLTAGRKKGSERVPAQNALSLVKAISPAMPYEVLEQFCQAMMQMPNQLGQHPCCTEAFNFIAETLSKEVATVEEGQKQALLAAKLLPGLLAVPLSMLNVQYIVSYAKALASLVAVLAQLHGSPLPEHVPRSLAALKLKACQKLLKLFEERDPTVLRGAKENCTLAFAAAGKHGDLALLEGLSDLCVPMLGFEFKGAFLHVLPVVTALFEALGALRSAKVSPAEVPAFLASQMPRARGLLEKLVQARDKARAGEIAFYGDVLEACLGAAVATYGAEAVLQVAEIRVLETPLNDPCFEQTSRSWMLLVLKKSIKCASLGFFVSKFLPMASTLKASSGRAAQAGELVVAKKYATLLEQVWALLPGFCDEPLDLGTALLAEGGKLAKILVTVLQSEPDLRGFVWAALHRACDSTREPPSALAQALQDSNRQCLQTLSGRIIPEMFNTYLKVYADFEGQDPARVATSKRIMLGSVQSYVRVSEPQFVGGLFKKLVARLLKATTGQGVEAGEAGAGPSELGQALPLADLASVLVPHLAPEFLELSLKVFTPMLSSGGVAAEESAGFEVKKATELVSHGLQKIAYRAVQGAIQHPSALEAGTKMLELWGPLQEARQTCSATALKARVRSLEAMLKLTEQVLSPKLKDPVIRQEYMRCLTSVMPEILFHLRDQSTTVRDTARECLHMAATTAIHQELQTEIVQLLSAGLAGLTRHSKACAVDALSRLLYEHSSRMQPELMDRLVGLVLLLLEDNDAQVWRAVLKFTKVIVHSLPSARLVAFVPQLLKIFDSKHVASAKMLIRKIIERLAKVLPAEVLDELFPRQHKALLVYIQRQLARQGRPQAVRATKEEGEDDEHKGDEDEDMGNDGRPKKSWEAFKEEDDVGEAGSSGAAVAAFPGKKRGRGTEPPTSAVMAHAAVQQLLDAWEEESDSDDDDMGKGKKKKGKRKRDEGKADTWIHEDQDIPMDFMSADAAHSVLTQRAAPTKRRRANEVGPAGAQNRIDALRRSGLRFAEDGRLVVDDEAEQKGSDDEDGGGGFNVGAEGTKKPKALSQLKAARDKRAEAKARAKAARKGAHTIKGLDSFKPKKKAQGDAKRGGGVLEPYAYISLNPKVAKEKYKGKATESFAKVIKGAKKGVTKGRKAREQDQKFKKQKQVRNQKKKAANNAKSRKNR